MHHVTKIGRCCYCGTEATLTLSGEVQHELACARCGAPLRKMKALRVDRDRKAQTGTIREPRPPKKPKAPKAKHGTRQGHHPRPKSKSRRKKRMVSVLSEIVEEVFDVFD